MSDMEGKVTRVGASERGQRTSFKNVEPAFTPRRAIAQVQQIREWS
jgi:hypothetical protein